MWLPDTNVWIALLNARPSIVKSRFESRSPAEILLCDVVKSELYFGAFRSARKVQNLALLDELFNSFESLPFDGMAARQCGELRADLANQGKPNGPYDLQIASIAVVNNCTLVTHNLAEFQRIPALTIEDWEG
jgi:tRNA(fMet)-specific endonuclease VapC